MAKFRRRRLPYRPLGAVLREHPEVARWLKHIRSPDRYEAVRGTVISNPVPGCHVYGLFVVDLDALVKTLRGQSAQTIAQDFFVYHPRHERRPRVYTGLKRNMARFCELYAGPNGDGYGCHREPERGWVCGDHRYADAIAVGVREGRFRAALNAAVIRARRRVKSRPKLADRSSELAFPHPEPLAQQGTTRAPQPRRTPQRVRDSSPRR